MERNAAKNDSSESEHLNITPKPNLRYPDLVDSKIINLVYKNQLKKVI